MNGHRHQGFLVTGGEQEETRGSTEIALQHYLCHHGLRLSVTVFARNANPSCAPARVDASWQSLCYYAGFYIPQALPP